MNQQAAASEYLVISRGKWEQDAAPAAIQRAIDAFYTWHDRLVAEGKMRAGQRLAPDAKLVAKNGITDGPFAETKEFIGGYWFIYAESLEAAAQIASGNPCLAYGLAFEIRPIELVKASAFTTTCETPKR